MLGFLAVDDLRTRFDPFTEQLSTHIARGHADVAVVADALGLAGIGRAVNVQFFRRALRWVFRKPHRSADGLSILAKRFQVDVFVPLQGGKSRVGHKVLAEAILARAQKKWDKQLSLAPSGGANFESARRSLLSHVNHFFGEGVLLIFLEGPGSLEVIVVDEFVDRVMHVSVVRGLEIGGVLEIEG